MNKTYWKRFKFIALIFVIFVSGLALYKGARIGNLIGTLISRNGKPMRCNQEFVSADMQ